MRHHRARPPAVSAGDAGWHTWGVFRHLALASSRTRLFSFVHISSIGLAGGLAPGEMLNIDYANVDGCAKVVAENPDVVLGVKVRITDSVVGQNGAGAAAARASAPPRWRARACA